mgnify:CR=1 FL=1
MFQVVLLSFNLHFILIPMGAISDHRAKMEAKTPGSAHMNFTLAGLISTGGLVGYMKAGSMPSLLAGVTVGAMYASSGFLIKNGQNTYGHAVATAASLALVGGMLPRAAAKGGAMPKIVTVLGLVSGIYNAKKLNDWFGQE